MYLLVIRHDFHYICGVDWPTNDGRRPRSAMSDSKNYKVKTRELKLKYPKKTKLNNLITIT